MRLLFLATIKGHLTLIVIDMAITVMLAENLTDRSMAHQLVRATYMQAFQLDINDLNVVQKNHFKSDVLVAFDSDDHKILGTMSVMYPNNNGVFPCESLFGFDLTGYDLSARRYVEIGRFATSEEGKRNRTVVISLFLGAIRRLQYMGINGWIATVKDDVFSFLKQLSLSLNDIGQAPGLLSSDLLKTYVGGNSALHLFDVSMSETERSFQRFESYLANGRIKLNNC